MQVFEALIRGHSKWGLSKGSKIEFRKCSTRPLSQLRLVFCLALCETNGGNSRHNSRNDCQNHEQLPTCTRSQRLHFAMGAGPTKQHVK